MNKALLHAADRGVVLRPGRVYRGVVVVTGETTLEELEDALAAGGFERGALLTASPADWRGIVPSDWPDEPQLDLAANECCVRVMGRIESATPVAFGRDERLPSGACFTLVQAWEYARGIGEATGAAPAPAPRPTESAGAMPIGLLLTAGALFGVGWFFNRRAEERAMRDQARLLAVVRREERSVIDARAEALEREGLSHADALAAAEEEANPTAITVEEFKSEARALAEASDA
jgi:hypothetical protein